MTKNNDDIAIDVALKPTGFTAKLKSRLLSAIDRRGASAIDNTGLQSEREIAIFRSQTDAYDKLFSSAVEAVRARIGEDPILASRVLASLSKAQREDESLKACLQLAAEDLSNRLLPSVDDANSPDAIEPDFLDRWEQYASHATTEKAREKWARILSAEVREPGSVSIKTMRIIDELDQGTAELFGRVCANRISGLLPELTLAIDENQQDELEIAGLIYKDLTPRYIDFGAVEGSDGVPVWIRTSVEHGIAINSAPATPFPIGNWQPVRIQDRKLVMNVIALTPSGKAIATILEHNELSAFSALREALNRDFGAACSSVLCRENNGRWKPLPVEDSKSMSDC